MAAHAVATDFARSSCTWLLPEQPSRGRFAIEASLGWLASGETFYLCSQVFAGNVYGEGSLFRLPPYEFSAAFSRSRYRIFRDAAAGEGEEDSMGSVDSRFRELHLDIAQRPAEAADWAELGREAPLSDFSVELLGADARLEFPLRHINLRAPDGRFQVETGPLLWALPGSAALEARLRRAYVAFNASDRAQLLVDERRPSKPGSRWSKVFDYPCRATLWRAR